MAEAKRRRIRESALSKYRESVSRSRVREADTLSVIEKTSIAAGHAVKMDKKMLNIAKGGSESDK